MSLIAIRPICNLSKQVPNFPTQLNHAQHSNRYSVERKYMSGQKVTLMARFLKTIHYWICKVFFYKPLFRSKSLVIIRFSYFCQGDTLGIVPDIPVVGATLLSWTSITFKWTNTLYLMSFQQHQQQLKRISTKSCNFSKITYTYIRNCSIFSTHRSRGQVLLFLSKILFTNRPFINYWEIIENHRVLCQLWLHYYVNYVYIGLSNFKVQIHQSPNSIRGAGAIRINNRAHRKNEPSW